ncbi:MAG TPA: cysteine synthase family protein [Gemmatimonadales bacterium]|nr:cysteine synthase family protein [Gemmatimonadales bacterium]
MNVLDAIGRTPLVELQRVVPPGAARVMAKLEFANPTGSMKDRFALSAIAAAERDGRLQAGGTVVEYTGGTTGVSLAFVCAAKGYRSRIVFSDAFSQDKGLMMQALGSDLMVLASGGTGITEKVIKDMIEAARALSREPGHWWCDQLNNRDALEGYAPMGEEMRKQAGGRVDAFVHVVGTAHSIHGASAGLRKGGKVHVVAVEPEESAVLAGRAGGGHGIDGIGIGFLPPLWEPDQVDELMAVSTADAKAMARRLASEEGIFAGTSSGANVVAALRVAGRLGRGATVVTIMVDSGLRYLHTSLFR